MSPPPRGPSGSVVLWLAQGFGVGRLPLAPGLWGSVLGLGWCALLLAGGHWRWFAAGTVAAFFLSVFCCGVAERLLKEKDPGSVVLDEIMAMPFCFAGWIFHRWLDTGHWPTVDYFLQPGVRWRVAGVFILFRVLDVWKPWPVRQSQALPGGWGVTVDDFLAAVYVNALVAVGLMLHWL